MHNKIRETREKAKQQKTKLEEKLKPLLMNYQCTLIAHNM